MATDIDELQIQIQASAKGANSSVTALIKRLEKLSNTISGIDSKKVLGLGVALKLIGSSGSSASSGLNKTATSATKAAKSFDGLASAFGKFYATYFLFIRGAKSIWKSVESSMDYVETSNYFSVALGQIGQQFEKSGYESAELYTEALASELSDLNKKLTGYTLGASGEALFGGDVGLGMDIEQIMNFQAKTLAVTNSVGLMGDASIETAKAVSMLAGDLSSLTNVDVESVMTNLSSGLIGQSRALYKYGIDITQNTLQQYALAEGIEKSVAEMTQAEKMQLRLLAILDQSTVAQSDLANTINSVANQYRVFNQQVDNTGRTLGNLFLPIVQNVLPYVNGLIIALNNLFTSLGFEIYGETWLEDLQQGISGGVQEDFEDLGGSVDDATESLEAFKKGVRGFDELNVLTVGTRVGSGIVGELEGQIDLTESITKAVANYENAWNEAFATAENKASEFAETLTVMFEKTNAVENFSEIVDSIKEFGEVVSPFTKGFGDGFLGFFGTLAETSLDAFTTSLDGLADVLEDVPPETLEKFGEGFGVLVGVVATFTAITALEKKFNSLASGLSTLGSTLKAHPLLASFALAEGLLYLINLPEDKAKIKIDVEMSDIDEQIANIRSSITTTSNLLSQTKKKMEAIDEIELEAVYEKWSALNSKVGELTDEEKGLLKAYSKRIIELFPEAEKYIDKNGEAYQDLADDLQVAIDKAILLAKVQGIDEIVSEYTEIQLRAEIDIENAKDSLDEIVEYFKGEFPELSEGEIWGMLGNYTETGQLYVPGTFKSPIKVSEERNPERVGSWDWLIGDFTHYQKLQELQEVADRFSEAYPDYKEAAENLQEAEDSLNKALEYSIELNKEYAETVQETEENTSSLNTLLEKMNNGTIPNLNEKFGIASDKAEEAEISIEELGEAIDDVNKKEINIPVSIGGGDINIGLRGLVSPNIMLKAHSRGGLVKSGEVISVRENGIPELVGRYGNQTMVANNQQITEAIKQAAYEGILAAISQSGGSSGGDVIVNMDGREVFRVVRSRANEHFRTTGKSAFDF